MYPAIRSTGNIYFHPKIFSYVPIIKIFLHCYMKIIFYISRLEVLARVQRGTINTEAENGICPCIAQLCMQLYSCTCTSYFKIHRQTLIGNNSKTRPSMPTPCFCLILVANQNFLFSLSITQVIECLGMQYWLHGC